MHGERLRALRERLGMSQQKLAEFLGVSVATVYRWERLTSSGPRGLVLVILCQLEAVEARHPQFAETLSEWIYRGIPYALHRLFVDALDHMQEPQDDDDREHE